MVTGHVLHTRKETITFKGFKNGLHLILDEEAPFPEIQEDLYNHLQKAGTFFAGAPVILQVGGRLLSPQEFQLLQQMLADQANITIAQVFSEREEVKAFVRERGLPLIGSPEQEGQKAPAPQRAARKTTTPNNTLLIKQTLRSGQRVIAEDHLVVIGDVNPGAELIAGGDVVVFGTLRGVAHAGMPDNPSAIIIALNLQPTQLRIANFIGRAPDWDTRREPIPEMAKIVNDQILIEVLNKKTETLIMTKERLQR